MLQETSILRFLEAFTDWELEHELVGVLGGQTYDVFLESGSREQQCQLLQTHNIVIFS